MYSYFFGPWLRIFSIVIAIIIFVVLICKAVKDRDTAKLRRKYALSAVALLLLTPYLMFVHGLERPPVISTTGVAKGCEQIEQIFSENGYQVVSFGCEKGFGEIYGQMEIHAGYISSGYPYNQKFVKHGTDGSVEYAFSSVVSDRHERSFLIHEGHVGEVYLYDSERNQTICIWYEQVNALTYLGFITALPPLQKFKVTDIADQEKTTFYPREATDAIF